MTAPSAASASAVALSFSPLNATTPIFSLPDEILLDIFEMAGAEDACALLCLSRTAKRFNDLLQASITPWRAAYLARYNYPKPLPYPPTPWWCVELKERMFTERTMRDSNPDVTFTGALCDVLMGLMRDVSVRAVDEVVMREAEVGDVQVAIANILHPPYNPRLSNGDRCFEALLHSPAFLHLYRHCAAQPLCNRYNNRPVSNGRTWRPHPRSVVFNQALCRLHLLRVDAKADRGWLRVMVYCRQWMWPETPFRRDGTVAWSQVDAIGTLMYLNILDLVKNGQNEWRSALRPLAGIHQIRGVASPNPVDWAGVAGVWHGAYAFMHYPDWVTLNEPDMSGLTPAHLRYYEENVGDMVEMVTQVVSSEADIQAHAPAGMTPRSLATALPSSDRLPPIYFVGCAGGGVTAEMDAFMYGVVRLTPDDCVRWSFVIHYEGHDQWLMNGVQIGGVGSARGWCGFWEEEQGIAHGPVWYWKA
ncbi:hypothetical protein CC85DRAFT_324819 [Cutaneotrichosporon oleaginosum]|uniref:F-box domain-containing protein n=1 Tax=Cutaneotrichosporon oleaginosum TaxID=879819 RepID=A0A0J0XZQ4_9TREE|nr:uncharacterized protein CC85DRAFT_324819 [Cutaneotrichosporon oleaginosum]KLT46513.1 hypothetical protein CC85DRAFT_324819 [Cutaneotrichosporon oleaginosum]TXT15120.1 hypothetical protein COLE_01313 [Cutaneotrichosporon oleaginosum]